MATVKQADDGTFTMACDKDQLGRPLEDGSPVKPCGFTSTAWPTEAGAAERGVQHDEEHASGLPMPQLHACGIEGAVA
jgi:hypothetical protein